MAARRSPEPAPAVVDDKLAPSPSKTGVKPLNPNALVWPAEARLSPVPATAQPQPVQQAGQPPVLFTPYQGTKILTPPTSNLRPLSPGQHTPLPVPDDVQLQQEFLVSRSVVQMTPRPALVAVLLSLLDDMPHLAATVRYRCERGTAVISPQHHSGVSGGGGGGGGGGQQPQGHGAVPWSMDTAGTTPPSQQRRRPQRHRDEEQQELCGLHNSTRALKHLQLNPTTGVYECIHGFHCLVDNQSREGSAPPSNAVTPKKDAAPKREGSSDSANVDVTRLQNILDSVRLAHPDQR